MELYSINAGSIMLDGGAMFGVVPKVMWNQWYPADENNMLELIMRSLLIVDGRRKILIDTGVGSKQGEKFKSIYYVTDNNLVAQLHKLGIDREEITDVILTHLHFDHCGSCIQLNEKTGQAELTFPNATHYIGATQWETANNPSMLEKASFLKENFSLLESSPNLHLVNGAQPLYENVFLRVFNGHTRGQLVINIHFNGKVLVHTADVIPVMAHIPLPYICAYDTSPLISVEDKRTILEEAYEKGYTLYFEHDLHQECCNLIRTEKGIRAGDSFSLEDFIG